jgi:glycosyltransferase involved in cell wall biosynthesis
MSKRVLFVIDSLGIGGAEKVLLTLAEQFYNQGLSIDVITIDNINAFSLPSYINFYTLSFEKKFLDYFLYSLSLFFLIKKNEKKNLSAYNLILVNLQKSTRLMKLYELFEKNQNIYHVIHNNLSSTAFKNRNYIKKFFKKLKIKNIYDNKNLIAVSEGVQYDLIENLNISPKSIQTIYNPIDSKQLLQQSAQSVDIKTSSLTPKQYFVHVGRFNPQKRHDILLKAYKQANIPYKLLLIGDGDERKNISQLIDDLHLTEQVIMLGFIQNPYPYIKNAKALVLSSDYEGFGLVLLEALILQTPAISTDCPSGPKEIFGKELQEHLSPIQDINALAENMQNISKIENFSTPQKVLEKFSLNYIVQQYTQLIK